MMGLANRTCCSLFSLSAAHTMGKTSTHRWDAMGALSPAISRIARTSVRTRVCPAHGPSAVKWVHRLHGSRLIHAFAPEATYQSCQRLRSVAPCCSRKAVCSATSVWALAGTTRGPEFLLAVASMSMLSGSDFTLSAPSKGLCGGRTPPCCRALGAARPVPCRANLSQPRRSWSQLPTLNPNHMALRLKMCSMWLLDSCILPARLHKSRSESDQACYPIGADTAAMTPSAARHPCACSFLNHTTPPWHCSWQSRSFC